MCSCVICRKEFSAKGIHSHWLASHGSFEQKQKMTGLGGKPRNQKHIVAMKKTQDRRIEYSKNPVICVCCGKPHGWKQRNNKTCSASCSAKLYNENRSSETIEKQKRSLLNHNQKIRENKHKISLNKSDGPYTKIYRNVCIFSGKVWYDITRKTIYPKLCDSKLDYRRSCSFEFSVFSFPLWFTEAKILIEQYGWYSTPGSNKRGIKNINGISRDHMISVTDGWQHKIPSNVINHPANCSLMPHKINQKKNSKSSISLEELYQRIEDFNRIYPEYESAKRVGIEPTSEGLESSVLPLN